MYEIKLMDETTVEVLEMQSIGHIVCVAPTREHVLEKARAFTRENLLSVTIMDAEKNVVGIYTELRGSVTVPDETVNGRCDFIVSLREKTLEERVSDAENAIGMMAATMLQ